MSILRTVEKAANTYDLDQMQYDALWDLLSDNPLLPSHSIASRNKALKTSKQNVIGAINELLDSIKKIDANVSAFDTSFKQALGDMGGTDAEAWEALQEIDGNVLRAVVRIWSDLGGEQDISEIGESVRDALKNLNNRLNNHEERIASLESAKHPIFVREEPSVRLEEPNVLYLSKVPNETEVTLKVNGLEYDENDDFTIDRSNKKLIWLHSEINGGFDLDLENDEFDVVYFTVN